MDALVHCNEFAASREGKETDFMSLSFSGKMNHKYGWTCEKDRNKLGMKMQEKCPTTKNVCKERREDYSTFQAQM